MHACACAEKCLHGIDWLGHHGDVLFCESVGVGQMRMHTRKCRSWTDTVLECGARWTDTVLECGARRTAFAGPMISLFRRMNSSCSAGCLMPSMTRSTLTQ
jgi:hypothetical protein